MTPTDIESQVGAAQGLWTHTPVDWAGNEPGMSGTPPGAWPANASQGRLGTSTGTRPNQVYFTASPPAGGVSILSVALTALTATTASIQFSLGSTPTATAVKYGTTPAVASTTAGTTSTSQTVNLSGLVTKTTYYYQVSATNASGTTLTSLMVFTTP